MKCNICNSDQFIEHRGKPNEKCATCGAKARHRIALEVYRQHLFNTLKELDGNVLHLAPEKALSGILAEHLGDRYEPADASPERYPHVSCRRMYFPDDFAAIPDGHFSAILHNHVLEHIPGHYKDHLHEFSRILKPGGKMIFSVPGPYLDRLTQEGGEHLASDEERLARFLQEDHFKVFGTDFVEFIEHLKGGELLADGITDDIRASLAVRPGKAPFFVWLKNS